MQGEQLINKAIVTKVSDNKTEVCLIKEDACEHCTSIFCNAHSQKDNIVTVNNKLSAQPGDEVLVSIQGKMLFQASVILYVIPLFLLISSIFIGISVFDKFVAKEALSFGIAIVVLSVYYSAIYLYKNYVKINTIKPDIIRINNSSKRQFFTNN